MTHYQMGIHSGIRPNMSALVRTFMTPRKKATVSRVRSVRADSQEAERVVRRVETFEEGKGGSAQGQRGQTGGADLRLEPL